LTLITIVVVCDLFKRLAKVANARHVYSPQGSRRHLPIISRELRGRA
jgi:acid stress-induced BolA-like protein IbaG/YrbA